MRNPFKLFLAAAGGVGLLCCVYTYSQRRPADSVAGTEQRLAHTLVSIDPRIATISEGVAELEKQSGVTFIVQWEKLADSYVLPGRRLAVHPGRTSAYEALTELLYLDGDADNGPIELSYFIDNEGRVVITTELDSIESSATPRVYDVSDLLRGRPSRAEAALVIETVVIENSDSISWKNRGGTVGGFYLCGDKLCIVQSQGAHGRVASMLEMLHADVLETGKLPSFPRRPPSASSE
jgi:hypothetical protein